jgi:signal transduction histidine kinase
MGFVAALVLQSNMSWDPVYAARFKVDLRTLLLMGGILKSIGLMGGLTFHNWSLGKQHKIHEQAKMDLASDQRRFINRLDHELKNPLTALHMTLAYLNSEDQVDVVRKVLIDMNTQVDRLSRLVGDLRKLTHLEEQSIQPSPLVLGEILQEVLEAAKDHPNIAGRQVSLTLLQHTLPLPMIQVDRGLLWLACFNLVDNALKFSQPGARIDVRAFEIHPGLVVEVADDGLGIPETELPHICDGLFRGENARGTPGSGLGLALARTILALHAGSLTVRSQPGQGTIFTMRFSVSD